MAEAPVAGCGAGKGRAEVGQGSGEHWGRNGLLWGGVTAGWARNPTLWMSTVPQSPRLPVFLRTEKAQSSPMTTISTGMPSARACSRARPKFSRSPV